MRKQTFKNLHFRNVEIGQRFLSCGNLYTKNSFSDAVLHRPGSSNPLSYFLPNTLVEAITEEKELSMKTLETPKAELLQKGFHLYKVTEDSANCLDIVCAQNAIDAAQWYFEETGVIPIPPDDIDEWDWLTETWIEDNDGEGGHLGPLVEEYYTPLIKEGKKIPFLADCQEI